MQIAQGCCDGFRIQTLTAKAGISVGFFEQSEGELIPSLLGPFEIDWMADTGVVSWLRI